MKIITPEAGESLFGYSQRMTYLRHYGESARSLSKALNSLTLTQSYQEANVQNINQLLEEAVGCEHFRFESHQSGWLKECLSVCPKCIDEGLVHQHSWQCNPVMYCETHKVLLVERCHVCGSAMRLTGSRLCQSCFSMHESKPVKPSEHLKLISSICREYPVDGGELIKLAVQLLMRPFDTFNAKTNVYTLSTKERLTLFSYVADIICCEETFVKIRDAMSRQARGFKFGAIYTELVEERWERLFQLKARLLPSARKVKSARVKYPMAEFKKVFTGPSTSRPIVKHDEPLITKSQLNSVLGLRRKSLIKLIEQKAIQTIKLEKQPTEMLSLIDVNRIVFKHTLIIENSSSDFIRASEVEPRKLKLFGICADEVDVALALGDLESFSVRGKPEKTPKEKLLIKPDALEIFATEMLLLNPRDLSFNKFSEIFNINGEDLKRNYKQLGLRSWKYTPKTSIRNEQFKEFLYSYESLGRLSRLHGIKERNILCYFNGCDGIIILRPWSKFNPQVLIKKTKENLKILKDVKSKVLPPINWIKKSHH